MAIRYYLDITGLSRVTKDYKQIFVQLENVEQLVNEESENPVSGGAVYTELQNITELIEGKLQYGSTSHWDNLSEQVSEENAVYFYLDSYTSQSGSNIARMKIGDGETTIGDLPFLDELYNEHINDSSIHVTDEEKTFWNNKVRAEVDDEEENLLLTIS